MAEARVDAAGGEGARALIVFARVPQLGRVKTRLAADIGERAALEAYREMLADTLARSAGARVQDAQLCIEGDDAGGECAALARRHGLRLTRQRGTGLGGRMHCALSAQVRQRRLAVLIGCDCPPLQASDIDAAFDALHSHDAVFAPTEDGGYALVGLKREIRRAFREQAWGGPDVMRHTRQALRAEGATWHELRTLWDVDAAAGYRRWRSFADGR